MFEFDEEKAFQAEMAVSHNEAFARRCVANYHKIKHKEMQEIFVAWINGKCIPFEYEGLTLEDICQKFKGASYGQAISEMDIIIGHPLAAKMFKTGELFPMK